MEAEAEAMKNFFTKLKRKRKRHQALPLPKHWFIQHLQLPCFVLNQLAFYFFSGRITFSCCPYTRCDYGRPSSTMLSFSQSRKIPPRSAAMISRVLEVLSLLQINPGQCSFFTKVSCRSLLSPQLPKIPQDQLKQAENVIILHRSIMDASTCLPGFV